MPEQLTHTLMMIRPARFKRNEQTAVNNFYQKELAGGAPEEMQGRARKEFDLLVGKLREEGVDVLVFDDTETPETPDALFPNNWISFHSGGEVILYPMFAPNRRLERREDLLITLRAKFQVSEIVSLVEWEQKEQFLEGTGSLVLDRENKLAYAALSGRTSPEILKDFEEKTGYLIVPFHAWQTVGRERKLIYHTNVMMAVGDQFAAICLECIDDLSERERVSNRLKETGKELVELSEKQVEQFAGNMLQVMSTTGKKLIVMSTSAYQSLNSSQKRILERYGKIIHSSLDTIEQLGGGSARCMIAEIFLPKK